MGELDGLGYAPSMPAFAALQAELSACRRSVGIQVLSDSTGDGTTDWPYLLAKSLAVLYPSWTVQHKLFNDTTQQYDAATVLSTGQPGGPLYLDSSTGSYGRMLPPDPVTRPHLTGAIDVRIKLSMDDWSNAGGLNSVAGKSGSDPLRGWYVGFSNTGAMFFAFSTNGLGANISVMYSTAAVPFPDGGTGWCRWVWTPDNGAAGRTLACYTSTDGQSWTQLGTTVTTAGAVVLFDNAARGYECGGAGQAPSAGCRTYEIQICNGVDGPNIVPAVPDLWPPLGTLSAGFKGAPVLTVVNGSVSGKDIAYHSDVTRLPKLTPDYGQTVGFLSTSHNEGNTVGGDWALKYQAWRNQVAARLPGVSLVSLTQNPEHTDATWGKEHAARRTGTLGLCNANNWPVIDTWKQFLDYGKWYPNLMGDSIHPNALGSGVLRDYILSRLVAD